MPKNPLQNDHHDLLTWMAGLPNYYWNAAWVQHLDLPLITLLILLPKFVQTIKHDSVYAFSILEIT